MAELWQNVRNVASCGVSVVGEWLGRGIELNPPVKRTVPREMNEKNVGANVSMKCILVCYINEMFLLCYILYIFQRFSVKGMVWQDSKARASRPDRFP